MIDIISAKKIMGKNFIGPQELELIADNLGVGKVSKIPEISYEAKMLKKYAKDYILILGIPKMIDGRPLTLVTLRSFLGWDSLKSEPCFYNQDWYLEESFAKDNTLESRWYLVQKEIISKTRGVLPDRIEKTINKTDKLPSAILTAVTFFAYYFLNKEILWKYDFIWCCDKDVNGDRVYTGRYKDPKGINKKGFNIHRHLSINSSYGAIVQR